MHVQSCVLHVSHGITKMVMLTGQRCCFPACLAGVRMCSGAGSVFKLLVQARCVGDAMACAGPCDHLVLSAHLVPFTSDAEVAFGSVI